MKGTECGNMTAPFQQVSPELETDPNTMFIKVPNPRRTSPTQERQALYDGRKRQKLSHSPEGQHGPVPRKPTAISAPSRPVQSQNSGSSDQSASKWFKEVNKNWTSARPQTSELDDDPPFYMANHANYVPANFVASEPRHGFGNITQSKMDSENEDLRAVIDDLTIENKRLKHMMRDLHRNHRPAGEAPQSEDKLFEVRMHGLPPEKRRELENLLKSFATSMRSRAPASGTSSLATSNSMQSKTSMNFANNKSTAPQTDSGYASNSNSNSATHSGGQVSLINNLPLSTSHKPSSKSRDVKNYLQDIPDTLLPRQKPVLSERAKSALVVRRLEQLFTGRQAAPGHHDQPMQQQEISQSAARADHSHEFGPGKKRKTEGPREASIMPPDSKVNLDAINVSESQDLPIPPRVRNLASSQEALTSNKLDSPDQRPTRPLDLDVHRAQVATENIQYLQHLGMPFAQPSDVTQNNSENWIFLNLLAGLAQLHTLNVTPEFIRRAIKKLSKKFELSKDGHKVRWVGGADETKFMAEYEKAMEVSTMSPQESNEDVGTAGGGSSKRSKSNSTSNPAMTSNAPSEDKTSGLQTSTDSRLQQATVSGTSNMQSSNITKQTTTSSAFDYKPIVYRGKPGLDYAESYLRDSDDSFDSQSGDSSGLVHALSKSNLSHKMNEEGPVTFYNHSHFFSDLSKDHQPSNMKRSRPVIVGETLGIPVPVEECESPLRFSDATYFATAFAPTPFQPRNAEEQKLLEMSIPKLHPIQNAGEDESMPMEFQVCGLGGISPADNFALDVKTEMVPVPSHAKGEVVIRKRPFSGHKYRLEYINTIKSCRKIDLLPSKLPPPTYIFFTSSSSSDAADPMDDMSDDTSDTSSPQVDEDFPAPPAFLQKFSQSSEELVNVSDGEMESDIDMLAIARKVDPIQIAEQERMYMINEPGAIAKAVAGSLAATVGASRSGSSTYEEAALADTSSVGSEHGSLADDEMFKV